MSRWLADEVVLLRQYHSEGFTHTKIAELLGRNQQSVSNKIVAEGLAENRLWTEQDIDILHKGVAEGLTCPQIAALLDRPPGGVGRKCRQLALMTKFGEVLRKQRELKTNGQKRCSRCGTVKPIIEDFRRSFGHCRDCEAKYHKTYKGGSLDAVLATRHRAAKGRANKKGLPFEITVKDLRRQWEKQEGQCFYTGKAMTFSPNEPNSVSVDRVVPRMGYIPENVVLCAWAVNYMKGDYSTEEFTLWCKAVCECHP